MAARLLRALAAAATLAACGTTSAPDLAVIPPESRPDAAAIAGCRETSILLDRRVNFLPPLYDFLDAIRTSGCPYASFRVDPPGIGYNDGYSQSEAVDAVRTYRRTHGLDWTARRRFEDPRIPDYHLKVTFLAPGSP